MSIQITRNMGGMGLVVCVCVRVGVHVCVV